MTHDQSTAVSTAVATSKHTEDAQARVDDLRAFRDAIPSISAPEDARSRRQLSVAASLSPEFIELGAMAIKNVPEMLGGVPNGEAIRDLMAFAGAFDPVADELETTAEVLRRTVTAARNKAGVAALVAYSVLKRFAKTPEGTHLSPHVAHMVRALGIRERKAKAKAIAARIKASAGDSPSEAPAPKL